MITETKKDTSFAAGTTGKKSEVPRQAISKWESNQANPDINNLLKLGEIYEASTDYILLGKETNRQIVSEEKIV